jgi:hypothetical protein
MMEHVYVYVASLAALLGFVGVVFQIRRAQE